MNEHDLSILFLQLAVMLAVALACGAVVRRWGMPVILGELLGGIILGPTVVGLVAPGAFSMLFPDISAISTTRDGLLKLGIVLFLFAAGLEVSLNSLHRRRSAIIGASLAGIAMPFALGAGSVLLLPTLWGAQAHSSFPFPLLIGTMLSISALPVIARILVDLNLAKEELGTIVMCAAAIDDLVGWSLFAALLSTAIPGAPDRNLLMTLLFVVALVGLVLGPGRRLARGGLRFIQKNLPQPGSSIAAALIAVLLVSALSEAIGIHAFLGAFLVGVALSGHTQERERAWSTIHQFVINFFAPIYFVSVGLRTNFVANFDPLLVLVVLVVACVGKVVGVSIGAWMGKLPANQALALGFGMNARGAMEMILAAPMVASVVDCLLEANPDLTPRQVRKVLTSTAQPLEGVARGRQGAGALNATQALASALRVKGAPLNGYPVSPQVGPYGVTFYLYDRHTNAVCVQGSWDDWSSPGVEAQQILPNIWRAHIDNIARGRYTYRFLLGGVYWLDDPDNPLKTPNKYGGFDSVLEIPARPSSSPTAAADLNARTPQPLRG